MRFKKDQKYSAKRVEHSGISFASKLESALYDRLLIEQASGEIRIEKIQEHVRLSLAEIVYIADFRIFDFRLGQSVWCEAKGFETERWPIIKKLWRFYGPGRLRIYKGTYKNLKLVEEIVSQVGPESATHQMTLNLKDEA